MQFKLSTNKIAYFLALVTMIVTIGLTIVPTPATGLYCWQCNSKMDKFCEDVPMGPVDNDTKLESCLRDLYRECPSEEDNVKYTFCRKQVQTVHNERRVIRSCGYIRSPVDCYVTKNPQLSSEVCQCDGDGCNGSMAQLASIQHNILAIVAALVIGRILLH